MLKNCIKNWKRIDDEMAADVAQRERSKIKCYASAFSNILIDLECDELLILIVSSDLQSIFKK